MVGGATKQVLERAGYYVRAVGSAAEVMVELRQVSDELVICDITMRPRSDVDAIPEILSEYPVMRIVAISGGGNFDVGIYQPEATTTSAYLAAAGQTGSHVILTKPFETRELIDTVGRALGAGHGCGWRNISINSAQC